MKLGKFGALVVGACAASVSAVDVESMPLLRPCALRRLPLGSIRPEGWLKCYLDKMTDGVCGRLYEHGAFLHTKNGWISKDEQGEFSESLHWNEKSGWEEQPYWFRSFVKLSVLTGNERMLGVCRDWVEKMLATQDADGWYGPQRLKRVPLEDGTYCQDLWGHMVMSEALLSWYDFSHDERIVGLLSKFVDFCLAVPESRFIKLEGARCKPSAGWLSQVQAMRAGDLIPTLFRLYDLTKDPRPVRLADKVWRRYYEKPCHLYLDMHNVNFCQRFSYPGIYARRTGDLALAEESEYWLRQHWMAWGQMPRCAFAADENSRLGCTDPRYGLESCSWGEYVRSFQNLADGRAETKWADRTEDVVFNHAPCAFTPDGKMVHYVTACNQVNLDGVTDHDYENRPPMVVYSSSGYRCCLYNASMPFPLFTENLVKRAQDGALFFWMYAPHSGKTAEAEWTLDTRYPFRETARLTVSAKKPLTLRFRVPAWATAFEVGAASAAAGAQTVDVAVPSGRSELDVRMTAVAKFTPWARQNGLSVDRGPLTYSVAVGERYSKGERVMGQGGSVTWKEAPDANSRGPQILTEVLPTTPWNYGLDVSRRPEWRPCAWRDDCFVSTNAPCEMIVRCRRLKEWTLQDNEPARLQLSPAYSAEPVEEVRFTPLGCQRLRLSVLPQVTDDAGIGHRWVVPPATTKREGRPRAIRFGTL